MFLNKNYWLLHSFKLATKSLYKRPLISKIHLCERWYCYVCSVSPQFRFANKFRYFDASLWYNAFKMVRVYLLRHIDLAACVLLSRTWKERWSILGNWNIHKERADILLNRKIRGCHRRRYRSTICYSRLICTAYTVLSFLSAVCYLADYGNNGIEKFNYSNVAVQLCSCHS